MEKKNMVLLTVIAVATLLVAVVGATFAYFTATITDERGGSGTDGQAAITAAQTPGSLIIEKNDSGFSSFNKTDVYPGHKELIQLSVTSDETNQTNTYFNIVYNGTSTFPENRIEFTIYESLEKIEGLDAQDAFNCVKKSEPESSGSTTYKLYEVCNINEKLSTTNAKLLQTTPLKTDGNKTILNGEHPFVITGTASDRTVYYYIVVTYKNETSDQGTLDQGQSINGKISIEIAASDSNAIKDDDTHLTTKSAA